MQAQSSSSVITAPCDQNAISQKFKWVSVYQIMSLAFTLCLAVPSKKEQVQVFLYPCNKTSQVQQWECRNETLLAIQGEDLFFSSGSRTKENIMLHKGSGVKSKWKIHGTSDGLCSWGYEGKVCKLILVFLFINLFMFPLGLQMRESTYKDEWKMHKKV